MPTLNTISIGLTLPHESLGKRLRWAVAASVLVNIIAWRAVAAMAKRPLYVAPRSVEITRVTIDNKGHKIEKVIKKEAIKKRVAQIRKKPPEQKVSTAAYHSQKRTEPPQHSKVITAPSKGPSNEEPVVADGGSAKVGVPVEQEAPELPVAEKKPDPPVAVKPPDPVKVERKPDPPPVAVKAPDPPPVVKQADPAPVAVPVRKGPTTDAEPSDEVKPEIPDDLKRGEFKSFVRVKVEIDEHGKPTPILRTSSGNAEIDKRVLDALKRWRWKPALENGSPVASTQLFKFEFLVE